MKPDRKAKQYAFALLETAKQTDCVKDIYESLQNLLILFKSNPHFRVFFLSRRIETEIKISILRTLLKNSGLDLVFEFIRILNQRNEMLLFKDVVISYAEQYKKAMNLLSVTTYVADKLSHEDLTTIISSLEKSKNKTMEINEVVDPDLLGGIKLRIGNIFLDGTLRYRLESLKEQLIQS